MQVAAIEPQFAGRRGAVAGIAREGVLDQPALKRIHRIAQRQVTGRRHLGRVGLVHRHRPQIQVLGVQGDDARLAGLLRQCPHGGATDQVLEFAHVARPRLLLQQGRLRVRRQAQAAQPQTHAVFFQKPAGQQQHVAAAPRSGGTCSG